MQTGVLCQLLATAPLSAQDLDARAYARVPIDATFITGEGLSDARLRLSVLVRGAIIRQGPDFSTFSIGWQTAWVPRPNPAR